MPGRKPIKKSAKRTYKKKSYKKSNYIGSLSRYNFATPMPPQVSAVLKYTSEAKSISTGVIANGMTFASTSIHDPDVSGIGHRPLGYNEMNNFYSKYRVDSMSYRVQFHSPDVDGIKTVVIFRKSSTSYGASTIERIAEAARQRIKIVSTDTPLKNGLFTGKVNNARVLGVTAEKFRVDDLYSAIMGANPDQKVHMDIMAQYKDNATVHNIYVTISFLYNVTFFGLKILATS